MLRRSFLRSSAVALTAGFGSTKLARAMFQAEGRAGAMPQKSYPPLQGPFRLPREWHMSNYRRLQSLLAEKKLAAAVITSTDNVQYLTGAFAVTTERPLWLWASAKEEPMLFYPGLDRDLWDSWDWPQQRTWYFDYPHAGELDKVVWKAGARSDLFDQALKYFRKNSTGTLSVGFERCLSEDDLAVLKRMPADKKITPDFKAVAPALLHMRQVKTAEEIALSRVAMSLHDRMMDFARDYILTHGTDASDFEVAHATEAFGAAELMKYLKLDGRPHNGVGVDVGFYCRTGAGTAYPHPNQFFYQRVQRGDAIQIAAGVRIGGYGGEGYRAMQILPAGGNIDPLRTKLWDVHTAMTLEQQKLSKAGVRCNAVGEGVLKLAREAGLEKYVYHRPAHGEGSEGHQAPYLSLGDNTVLEENMTFSNEPGLYNPAGGFGYNHSNLLRVTLAGGEQMNRTPLTKDWCWIKI